jgi:hypothetical protein
MRHLGTVIVLVGFVGTLSGCPSILGLDGNYTAGGDHGSDGGETSDAPVNSDGAIPGDGGHHGGAKHDGSATDSGGGGTDTGKPDDDGGAGDSSKPSDSGHTPPLDACPVACPLTAPSGWTLVAYEQSQSDACPAGFTQTEIVEPSGTGSCSCGSCTLTTEPDCYPAYPVTITSMWNVTGDTCDGTGGYFPTNGGACETDAIGNAGYMSVTGPAPVAGACTATASGSGPTTTAERVCTPTECPSDACESSLGSSFKTCLYQSGDQTCPDSLTKHTVGSSADVTCSTCGCSVATTGCSGTMAIYDSTTGCTGSPVITMNADGTCYLMPSGTEGDSYIYTASPTGVSCDVGTSSPTVNITGQGTICCP